jgi:hypothetical protein
MSSLTVSPHSSARLLEVQTNKPLTSMGRALTNNRHLSQLKSRKASKEMTVCSGSETKETSKQTERLREALQKIIALKKESMKVTEFLEPKSQRVSISMNP